MPAIRRPLLILLIALLAFVATLALRRPEPSAPPRRAAASASPCGPRTFEGTEFTVCSFDSRRDRLELLVDNPSGAKLRSLPGLEAALGPRTASVRFAMNAGMFDEAGNPIGLFIAEGREKKRINLRAGGGNFHLMPNGVFAQDRDGHVHVVRSQDFAGRVPGPRWATQSGPMLVIDGKLHPSFDADGESRLIRNGVGVSDANTAWFAISEEASRSDVSRGCSATR